MNLNVGQIADVLFEKTRSGGMISGFSGNYLRVEYPWQQGLAGDIKKVRIKGITPSGKMSIEIIN